MPPLNESTSQRLSRDQRLKPSVLDRLIVREESSGPTLRDIKEWLRRDLEDLLNTRPRCRSWSPGLTELEDSLVNYGPPDFTGLHLGGPANQESFRQSVQDVIERFEPRLQNVRVHRKTKANSLDRVLSFRIEATLCVNPIEEPIIFESTLKPLSAGFAVTRAER
jgi:type VI secretion system protein ImpF